MKKIFRKKSVGISLGIILLTGSLSLAYRPVDHYFAIAKNLSIFAAVFRDLDRYYVDSIQPEKLIHSSIEAMTGSLDPYTYFYSEDDLNDLEFQTTGQYAGVGISIRESGDHIVISNIYDHTPMREAGVRAGDIIVALNGQPARGLSTEQVSLLLRGEPGTKLNIVLRNPASGHDKTYKITRAEININSIPYYGTVGEGIAYIRMNQFTKLSSLGVASAFKTLSKEHPGLKGLILDLRNNPGGLLEEAVKTTGLFVDEGTPVVSTRGRVTDWNRTYKTMESPINDNIPLIVLTNGMTASASEIVAGAVQDLDRGLIIGQRSFGKGLVQATRSLPYHTEMKITTAKYYTPSGRCIQAIDYTHRLTDGSVTFLPDSLKRSFKTRNGRTVRDGGGIAPDITTPVEKLSNISHTLLAQSYIFDFATQYYYAHLTPPSNEDFHLNEKDFMAFLKFLDGKNYDYKTGSEMALEQFRKTARQEQYFDAVKEEFTALQNKMKHDKHHDLLKHKNEIRQLLEEEIVGRYHFQAGRIAQHLKYDATVIKAASLLARPSLYDSLLLAKNNPH